MTPKEKAIDYIKKDCSQLDVIKKIEKAIDIALQEQAKDILTKVGRIANWNEPQQIEIDKLWKKYLHNPVKSSKK